MSESDTEGQRRGPGEQDYAVGYLGGPDAGFFADADAGSDQPYNLGYYEDSDSTTAAIRDDARERGIQPDVYWEHDGERQGDGYTEIPGYWEGREAPEIQLEEHRDEDHPLLRPSPSDYIITDERDGVGVTHEEAGIGYYDSRPEAELGVREYAEQHQIWGNVWHENERGNQSLDAGFWSEERRAENEQDVDRVHREEERGAYDPRNIEEDEEESYIEEEPERPQSPAEKAGVSPSDYEAAKQRQDEESQGQSL